MVVIQLPWPPSVNTMWRTPRTGPLAGRTMLSKEGRDYRKAVEQAVMLQCVPKVGDAKVAVDIEVRMPDKRRRDLDNLPKAVLDGLTHAALWHDDSQIDDLRVWRSDRMGGCLVVKVRELSLPQGCLVEDKADADAF